MKNEEISVVTLINTLLEFIQMTPNKTEWDLDSLIDNNPRLIRLQQIKILLSIYTPETYYPNDLRSSIEATVSGQFLLFRHEEIYDDAYKMMENEIRRFKPEFKNIDRTNNRILQYNFEKASNYLIQLQKLLNYNSGQLLLSPEHSYSYILTEMVNGGIDKNKLIELTAVLMDPTKTIFKRETLVKNMGFPDDDIDEVDQMYM